MVQLIATVHKERPTYLALHWLFEKKEKIVTE